MIKHATDKLALVGAVVAVVAAIAGATAPSANAATFSWNCNAPCVMPGVQATVDLTCNTVYHANGTKTWRISAHVFTTHWGGVPDHRLDLAWAVKAGASTYGAYYKSGVTIGTALPTLSWTVPSRSAGVRVQLVYSFALTANGQTTNSGAELANGVTMKNGFQNTFGGPFSDCLLY